MPQESSSSMNLTNLKLEFEIRGCDRIYVKKLAPNDNSKNQVYFGGSFELLNVLPIKDIRTETAGEWKKERFKATVDFAWIGEDGQLHSAPNAQLILYPNYPEVRFSGFLLGCANAPSQLMTRRQADRLLFLGVSSSGRVLGYVSDPSSDVAVEYGRITAGSQLGVFEVFELSKSVNNRERLLNELRRIHRLGWIKSKRLDSTGKLLPCEASQCGGYTLEAELGVTPNGYSEPDFLGWEVKSFGVANFQRVLSKVITLMTPEPTGGLYKSRGAEYFIRTYGYADKLGRPDRINVGGVHKVGTVQALTNLELRIQGFDAHSGRIRNTDGEIALIDLQGAIAASWSFSSLLLHWNRKHNQACYVPSQSATSGERMYRYGSEIILGTGTDFQLFLRQMASGNIYYDPGIKIENLSSKPKIKKRSQFRIKSEFLQKLYKYSEVLDLNIDSILI